DEVRGGGRRGGESPASMEGGARTILFVCFASRRTRAVPGIGPSRRDGGAPHRRASPFAPSDGAGGRLEVGAVGSANEARKADIDPDGTGGVCKSEACARAGVAD